MDHHNGLQIGGQVGKVPRKGVYIIWKSPLKVRQFPRDRGCHVIGNTYRYPFNLPEGGGGLYMYHTNCVSEPIGPIPGNARFPPPMGF